MRNVTGCIGVLLSILLVGCSSGVSQEEVDEAIDLAVREASLELEERTKQSLDESIQTIQDYLVEYRNLTDDSVNKIIDDGQASIMESAEATAKDTLATVNQNTKTLVAMVCEADYWVNTTWSIVDALLAYLESSDPVLLEEANQFFNGIVIEDNYGDVSTICTVDADGRWAPIKQPDKIDPRRRG